MEKRPDSLAERLKAANRAAAAELVDSYYQQIFLFFRRLGHNRQVSEDLTQESFLQAWQHIGQLRSNELLNSWLYRIAGNISKQYWRGHKNMDALSIEQTDIDVPDSSEPGSDNMELVDQLRRVKNAIAKLPIKLRQPLVLHYMQHLNVGEAAEAAGVREGTFKSRLNRALKALRKKLS